MLTDLPDDLDLLLALDVLLRERHVTRAAARLGVTQSAASQRLGRLREFFGDPLLVAGRPLMTLTPRAEAIAGPLSQAIADLRAAIRSGAPFDPRSSERRFVILGNDLAEALALPVLMATFAETAPSVSVHMERADADFSNRLARGTADLALVPDFIVPESLRRFALAPEPFVVLMRRGHPLGSRKLTLERFLALRHLLIAPRGMPGSVVDDALERLGKTRRVVARVQHFAAAPFVVAASDLAVTCPASVAPLGLPFGLVVRPLPLKVPLDRSSVVWHERAHRDAGHVWLRSLIRRRPSGSPS